MTERQQDQVWYDPVSGNPLWYDPMSGRWFEVAPSPPSPCTRTVARPALGWVLFGSGTGVLVGTFLPWVTVFGGLLKIYGTDVGAGWINFVLALLIMSFGLLIVRRWGDLKVTIPALIVSVATIALGIYETAKVPTGGELGISVGLGLPVIIVAGLAAGLISLLSMVKKICFDGS